MRLQAAVVNRRQKQEETKTQEETRKRLETRMEDLSLYTASVAHDIGTPLAALSMGLQLLAKSCLSPEQQEMVQDLQAAEEMVPPRDDDAPP